MYIGLEEECHCITITDGHVSRQEILVGINEDTIITVHGPSVGPFIIS